MAFPVKLLGRNIRTITGSTLTTSYQNIGSVTTLVSYKVSIINATTTDVYVYDGSAGDAIYIPAGATVSMGDADSTADGQATFLKGCQLQAKLVTGAAGTGTLVILLLGN